jgi:hypothetical protein
MVAEPETEARRFGFEELQAQREFSGGRSIKAALNIARRIWLGVAFHSLSTSTFMRLAALRAPVQPRRSPYMSSRLARATVAENCDRNCSFIGGV